VFRLLRVTFLAERQAELLGNRHAPSLAMLQRLMNIRSEPIRTVMRQLLREMDDPGLGAAAAAGALVRLLGVELLRLLDEDFEPRAGGRLAPWQFRRLRERIEAGGARPTVAELAELCGISVRHLHRQFLNLTGVTISDYVEAQLVSRAKGLLAGTGLSIRQIAMQSGFDHANSFSRTFRRATGMTPLHYRQLKSGRGAKEWVDAGTCSA
jgi:AraC family transcriptional regulator